MCNISTDIEKFRLSFGVLLFKMCCGNVDIYHHLLVGSQPLLSILYWYLQWLDAIYRR